MAEVKAYIQKRDLKTALLAEKDSIREAVNRQSFEAEQHRDKEINAVRDRCYEEVNRIRDKAKALMEPIDQGIRELEPEIQDIDRKIEFLKQREEIKGRTVYQIDHELIAPHHDKELVDLGTFYEDEFTIMKLFAIENDRPKNCWTLMAIGDTLLRDLVKMPHEYGLPFHTAYWLIQKALRHLPTIEEIKAYAENRRENLMDLTAYEEVKTAYVNTINNYSLEDFKPILEPRKVSNHEAPVVFRITGPGDSLEYRLYHGFYYRTAGEVDIPFNHIEVNEVIYRRYCRPEQLKITETGNTMFGDWWSVSVKNTWGGVIFNRENWERTIAEATYRIDELNAERVTPVHFNPPEIEWITPVPEEFFNIPKL
uniref:Uncharacterized protein n=1 Tax=viral metagenome TaxID=1070528 RepID=A0A6M3LZ98_9ZZZZ